MASGAGEIVPDDGEQAVIAEAVNYWEEGGEYCA